MIFCFSFSRNSLGSLARVRTKVRQVSAKVVIPFLPSTAIRADIGEDCATERAIAAKADAVGGGFHLRNSNVRG